MEAGGSGEIIVVLFADHVGSLSATPNLPNNAVTSPRSVPLSASVINHRGTTVHALAESWHEIVPSDSIRQTAERLLRAHPLRAAGSLQLAAALIAADHDPMALEFVCLDVRLARAAQREGFVVVGP